MYLGAECCRWSRISGSRVAGRYTDSIHVDAVARCGSIFGRVVV